MALFICTLCAKTGCREHEDRLINSQPINNSGIALNVSRARLTVLGFALTVSVFAIGNVLFFSGEVVSPRIIWQLNILIALLSGVTIGMVSAVLFLISQRLDREGLSDKGIFAFAEMTMYLSLAYTLNGLTLEVLNLFSLNLGTFTTQQGDGSASAEMLQLMARWLGSLAWIFIAFVAPAWFLKRLPEPPRRKILYLSYYIAFMTLIAVLNALASEVSLTAAGQDPSFIGLFLKQFFAPFIWSDLVITGY